MENASKGLLIAGGILVAILIITMGIIIYNNSLGSIETGVSQTNMQEIMIYNAKFTIYEGIQSGSKVKECLMEAIYANAGNDDTTSPIAENVGIKTNDLQIINSITDSEIKRGLTTRNYGVRQVKNIAKVLKLINDSSKYQVYFDYNENGVIYTIHFDLKN